MTVDPGDWGGAAQARLDAIRSADRWRATVELDAFGNEGRLGAGRDVVTFASNDYLGLTAHPTVIEAAIEATRHGGSGSGASRLVVGSRPVHAELEAELADWKGTERAVLFPTGYAANLGVVTAVAAAAPGGVVPLICSDELNHASIIDACKLARAEVAVYPHGDVAAVERLVAGAAAAGRPVAVVTDTVFSMDGDEAPLAELVALCGSYRVLLILDEAHAVLGPELPEPPARPAGAFSAVTLGGSVDGPTVLRVGTLSKTLGSLGGFVACPEVFADLFVNTARPYIFTTAPPPGNAAAALAALRIVRSPEGAALVARLRRLIDRVAPGHPSPIVPVVLGSDERALRAAAFLLERGLLVPAIRPPTVPVGSARLRVTLSAAHTDAQVDALVGALHELQVGVAP